MRAPERLSMTLLFVCLLLIYSGFSLFVMQFWRSRSTQAYPLKQELMLLAPVLLLNGVWLWWPILESQRLLLGFGHAMAMLSWITLILYWGGSYFYRLQGLQLFLFPIAVISLLCDYFLPGATAGVVVNNSAFALHIMSSLLAYSLFALATLLAWLMLWLARDLRQHRLSPSISFLPPLLSIEKLMFQSITMGFVSLTIALLSGMLFSEYVFGHAFTWTHKIIFGLASWMIYAAILVLRWRQGARGKKIAMAVIVGFVLLMLAYAGSKFVLEIVLQNH